MTAGRKLELMTPTAQGARMGCDFATACAANLPLKTAEQWWTVSCVVFNIDPSEQDEIKAGFLAALNAAGAKQ